MNGSHHESTLKTLSTTRERERTNVSVSVHGEEEVLGAHLEAHL